MQIEINTSKQFPMAKLTLDADEEARIQPGSMIYHTPSIQLLTSLNGHGEGFGKLLGAIGRSLTSDESMLITKVQAQGQSGMIALAPDTPGQIGVLHCHDDQQYHINDSKFLAMSQNANYTMERQKAVKGFLSGTGGFYVMTTQGEGKILVNSFGSIEKIDLKDDQITIDNNHVVAWSTTLDYDIHFEGGFWQSVGTGEGLVNTFSGTGTIFIQTLNLETFAGSLVPFLPDNSN